MAEATGGTASILITVATLLKNMIGAGIFSLPRGMLHASPVLGIFILAFVGALSAASYWMIGYCCLTCGVSTFRELWYRVFSKRSAWVIDVTIFLNGWFTLTGYLVLIGDFTSKSFEGLLGEEHFLSRGRARNVWVITVLVLLPLSLSKDLSKLAFTSMLGLCVVLYVVVLVIQDSWFYSPPEWGPDVVLFEWRMGVFEAIAIYTHAFVAHYNAPKLFSELAKPSHMRWLLVVVIAYSIAFITYSSFALAGFRRFEDEVMGNILRNYGSRFSVLVAWLGMGFCIAFTYPLVFNSMREAAVNLFVAFQGALRASPSFQAVMASPRSQAWINRTSYLANALGPYPARIRHRPGRKTTVVLVLLTAVVGSLCDDLGIVNALTGSLMGVLICLVLPAMIFVKTILIQLRGKDPADADDLSEPLLPKKGHVVKKPHRSPALLALAVAVGLGTAVTGLAFCVIGTAVVLHRAM